MESPYTVRRSARRTVTLRLLGDGTLVVCCPNRMTEEEVRALVTRKRGWIEKQRALLEQRPTVEPCTQAELEALRSEAQARIPDKVAHWAPLVGVSYGRVSVRCQRTLWGSCSGAGNLSFNCLLAAMPEDVMDYVIIHELCHRKEMNHSPRFWAEVARVCPKWQESRAWLKANGAALMARLP